MNKTVLLFQRLTVVASDVVFYVGCFYVTSALLQNTRKSTSQRVLTFILLVSNPSLILLDNVHFQYNSMMYGILLLAIAAFCRGSYLKASLFFSILLNFKHIYLYYTFGLILCFINAYVMPLQCSSVTRLAKLGICVLAPCASSLGPFVLLGGFKQLTQIIARLFPFKRGLTHSYWAPNFWALYNTLDLALYKLSGGNSTPEYTTGKVNTFAHYYLPEVTVFTTLALVFSSSLCLTFLRRSDANERFLCALASSAFSFLLFSWHVHEKATLLVQVPLLLLALKNPSFASLALLFSQASTFSLFPLFWENCVENILKVSLALCQIALYKAYFSNGFQIGVIDVPNRIFFVGSLGLEVYKAVIHHLIFANRASFLPLLMTSVWCALAVHYVYVGLLYKMISSHSRRTNPVKHATS